MATRSIVPRADSEGGLGTTLKRWATSFIDAMVCSSIKIETGAGANKLLQSDADGDATWSDALTIASVKITGGTPGAGKLLQSDADGDATWETVAASMAEIQQVIDNLSFTATVAAKALTIALKGVDGNDCSASNIATIAFRSATLTDGKPVFRTVTGALSVVLASGGTLGFGAAEAGRLYVWAIDNAGTVELALSRTADIFPEGNLVTTVAIGAGSDLATAMYSTTQRTNLACRCIGYIEITTGAVAGEWDNAPTKIQVMGPGVKRTGDVVQIPRNPTGAVATGTTNMPSDDTIPQITEGDQYMSQAIIPTSAINFLYITVNIFGGNTTQDVSTVALFQDATAGALAAQAWYQNAGGILSSITLKHRMIAGTIVSTTFTVRAGRHSSGTFTFNGWSSGRLYGGVAVSSIEVMEVFA